MKPASDFSITRKCRDTGTMISVHGPGAHTKPEKGWAITCEDHNKTVFAPSRAEVVKIAGSPREWCARCAKLPEHVVVKKASKATAKKVAKPAVAEAKKTPLMSAEELAKAKAQLAKATGQPAPTPPAIKKQPKGQPPVLSAETKETISLVNACAFDGGKAPTLPAIVKAMQESLPGLTVIAVKNRPDKADSGLRIKVTKFDKGTEEDEVVFEHNSEAKGKTNKDVCVWFAGQLV